MQNWGFPGLQPPPSRESLFRRPPPFNGPYRLSAAEAAALSHPGPALHFERSPEDRLLQIRHQPSVSSIQSRDRVEVRLLVLDSYIGGLIGRGGNNVKRIRQMFGARVIVSNTKGGDPEHRVVTICAGADQVAYIVGAIFQYIVPPTLHDNIAYNCSMLVPQACIGRILGPKGLFIKKISEDTRTYQRLYCETVMPESDEIPYSFRGQSVDVGEAVGLIADRLRGYCANSTYDPAQHPLTVHAGRKRSHPSE
ncbi:hypothetical protein L596_002237 [Steinernema carpocapsae]|uniref:K Homology domain-containing protein n=1 Tax=Steinernema carpocapsae TaxID=34508 RepID=A0A4U8UNJ9_STECR|nr:hypothetical protein L596_002237 [Steinernema carpocapsae]